MDAPPATPRRKHIIVIMDGAADEPQPALGGLTPLQAARIPHSDSVAGDGICGLAQTIPDEMEPGSDIGHYRVVRGYNDAAQHSQCLYATFAHMPGLKVVVPSNAYDAKGLMIQSIRDDNPVMFMYHKGIMGLPWMAYFEGSSSEVPDEPYTVPIGEPAVRTEGTDITIVGYAPQTVEIARAVEALKKDGISAEFIDPRTLAPLEGVMPAIVNSARKTGRLLTSDDGSYSFCNCTEIVARVAETLPGTKVKRLAFPDAPAPGAPEMLYHMRVGASSIVAAAKTLMRG